jgi:hypothetical protein
MHGCYMSMWIPRSSLLFVLFDFFRNLELEIFFCVLWIISTNFIDSLLFGLGDFLFVAILNAIEQRAITLFPSSAFVIEVVV